MRLSDFIIEDMEGILAQWEAFAAANVPAARTMTSTALRDHAEGILRAIAKDLTTAQSREAQTAKSQGLAPEPVNASETAAQTHGFLRANSGFDITEMASEYRALRASVLRRWTDAHPTNVPSLNELVRFNEGIDQALSESVTYFSARMEEARNLFLGTLGHDMRTPLQAILLTASYLGELNAGAAVSEAASRLIRSGGRMQALVAGLVEFDRTGLGFASHARTSRVDLAELFRLELEEVHAAYPDSTVMFEVEGDTHGAWDALSLQRVVGNLVVNAIKYGAKHTPVLVKLSGTANEVLFEVRNTGDHIERSELKSFFEPRKRGAHAADLPNDEPGLGLGLYIARQIATAQGGEINARCEGGHVIFEVRLPRRPSSAM